MSRRPPRPDTAKDVTSDNNARIENIFHITTPHSSRRMSDASETDGMTVDDGSSRQKPHSQAPEPSEEDLDTATRNLITKGEIPPSDLHGPLLQRLKTDSFLALVAQDYDRAAALDAAAARLAEECECEMYLNQKQEEEKTIQERLRCARTNLSRERERWEKIMDVFQREERADRRALAEKQAEEERAFEDEWEDPSILIQFKKASPQLLLLRKQQKKLGLVKQFADAKHVKRLADQLEIEETEGAEMRAITAMQLAHEKLVEQHRKERECFEEHEVRTRQYLEAERRKAIEPIERLIAQLEIARDKNKPTNMKPRKFAFTSTRRTRVMRTERGLTAPSPRTTRAICDYKVSEEPPKLSLGRLNVRKIVSTKRPVSVIRTRK